MIYFLLLWLIDFGRWINSSIKKSFQISPKIQNTFVLAIIFGSSSLFILHRDFRLFTECGMEGWQIFETFPSLNFILFFSSWDIQLDMDWL